VKQINYSRKNVSLSNKTTLVQELNFTYLGFLYQSNQFIWN